MRGKLLILTFAAIMLVAMACTPKVVNSSVGTVITPIDEIGNYLGEQITTCGQVVEARYQLFEKGRPTYLYVDDKFPFHKLAVVVMERDRDKFPEKLETAYNGDNICVAGEIRGYADQPEMLIQSPAQLEVLEAPNAARYR